MPQSGVEGRYPGRRQPIESALYPRAGCCGARCITSFAITAIIWSDHAQNMGQGRRALLIGVTRQESAFALILARRGDLALRIRRRPCSPLASCWLLAQRQWDRIEARSRFGHRYGRPQSDGLAKMARDDTAAAVKGKPDDWPAARNKAKPLIMGRG